MNIATWMALMPLKFYLCTLNPSSFFQTLSSKNVPVNSSFPILSIFLRTPNPINSTSIIFVKTTNFSTSTANIMTQTTTFSGLASYTSLQSGLPRYVLASPHPFFAK